LVVLVLVLDKVSHYRLQLLIDDPIQTIVATKESPDHKYTVFATASCFQGCTYTIYVSRWFYLRPRRIMDVGMEDFHIRGDREGDLSTIWSSDGNRVALICQGWVVDFYDFRTDRRMPCPVGLGPDTERNELQEYELIVLYVLGRTGERVVFVR